MSQEKMPSHSDKVPAGGDMEKLLEREKRIGNLEIVSIYEGKGVEVNPDQEGKAIMTRQLNGCVATIVACETAEGKRIVQLTHFPDFSRDRQKQTAQQMITPEMQAAVKKKALLFLQRKRSEGAEELGKFFAGLLGEQAVVETHLYESDSTLEDNGSIVVRVPSKQTGEMNYLTWYNSGAI